MANAVRADVTSHDDIRGMVDACMDIYGRIDVVDYNVGLAHLGGIVDWPRKSGTESSQSTSRAAFSR